jgi:hypothetical protein
MLRDSDCSWSPRLHLVYRLLRYLLCSMLFLTAAAYGQDARWSRIRGVNFFSSNAVNATDMWRHFDPISADRELGWMEDLGFNSVRLWLSERAWRENPELFADNLTAALGLSEKHKLSVMLVLFDSCGIEPRNDAVPTAIGEVYETFCIRRCCPTSKSNSSAAAMLRLPRAAVDTLLCRSEKIRHPTSSSGKTGVRTRVYPKSARRTGQSLTLIPMRS